MKNQNTMIAASLAGAILLSGVANAQSGGRDTAVFELYGERSWSVSCEVGQDDGDLINARERGRGARDTGRIVVADAVSGSCSYDVPENGALMVSMQTRHSVFDCPFTVTADGYCQAQFAPGTSGTFQFRRMAGATAGTGS
ncbi:MAG: hypothetical protein GYB36_13495 [Alphaproteobacteria bacterium]|nr:hypothetical protein [Alphaproteobacteria bacterium]